MAGQSLGEALLKCLQSREVSKNDTLDLIISGIECSLWLGEQLAADIRLLFPHLNVIAISSNK
jgi:hypothetical protein